MMVSKIAVAALVLIVACPILLGYGLNLSETTKTGYTLTGDQINLTDQLTNGSAGSSYNYAHGDITQMNTNFNRVQQVSGQSFPHFENIITENASYPIFQDDFTNHTFNNETLDLSLYRFFYIEFEQSTVAMNIYKTVGGVESYAGTVGNVYAVYIEHVPVKNCIVYYYSGSGYDISTAYSGLEVNSILINGGATDGYSTYRYVSASPAPPNDHYLDISAGYYFENTTGYNAYPTQWPSITLPESTKQFTLTMDLNSITDSTYSLHINLAPEYMRRYTNPFSNLPMELSKTTTGGIAKWTLTNEMDSSAPVTELYTDPSLSSNTYQFTISAESIYNETTQKYYLSVHVRAAYIGEWPTLIGIANPYIVYDLDYVMLDDPNYILNTPIPDDDLLYFNIKMKADNAARTPLMRVDDALFRAFAYQTITDRTFMPSAYKENPGITISNVKMFGSSITFGGITYSVNGNLITVNGRAVKLNDAVFNTELNEYGTYDNKINGIRVSTTASDPGMTFGGSWVANVTAQSMTAYNYTTTEWTPGHFGWNGIDQNFLMVGMLTAIGVFVGLGIYARSHNMRIWPVLLVCGGAIILFFCMI